MAVAGGGSVTGRWLALVTIDAAQVHPRAVVDRVGLATPVGGHLRAANE